MNASGVHQSPRQQKPTRQGKVRDLYDLGDRLLLVTTDRISAFDCVLPDPIPLKGKVLTALSRFWFQRLADVCPHHLIEVVSDRAPKGFEDQLDDLRGRAMVCRKAEVVPIECVVRGYFAGSGWKEYRSKGTVCGIKLPANLAQCDRLPEPIFTPATKADVGHDENISFDAACDRVGRQLMEQLRDVSIELYRRGAEYAKSRGIILADTKFEFGTTPEGILWIDEAMTPDSSRFWPADKYEPGRDQESFDKQFVRNYLQELCDAGKWDKTDPAPHLPPNIIEATSARYIEAYERLTQTSFPQ